MSFLIKNINNKNPQEQIEERIKFFLKSQSPTNLKQKNLKRAHNNDNYATLIDSINLNNEKISQYIYCRNNNTENNNNNLIKDRLNESTLSTQTVNNIFDVPVKKSISIQVSKEMAKYTEPKLKRREFLKLPQKFNPFNEKDNIKSYNDNDNTLNKVYSKNRHRYTNSELEILETDEKVSQKQIEEITNNNISNLSLNNIEDIIIIVIYYLFFNL
jgi:hypothetical protein